jgi:O-antigen ligase
MRSVFSHVRRNAVYIVLIGLITPTATITSYLFGLTPIFKGQATSIVLSLALFSVALVLWLGFRPTAKPQLLFKVFLALNIVAWVVIAALVWRDGDMFAHTTFLAPLIYAMVFIKPPNLKWALIGGDTFALSLVSISVLSHVLHVSGIHLYPNAFPSRLPEFVWSLGLENRWEGPFASTSDSGPVAAFIIFYALMRNGKIRVILLSAGLVFLIVSTSWTSIYSSIIGSVVLLWFIPSLFDRPITTAIRFAISGVLLGGSVIYVFLFDPTFNGRTHIWLDYLGVWVQNPVVGVGTSGLVDFYNQSELTHQHGHNYYVDILARHGIIGFLVTVPVLVVAGVIAFKAGRRGLWAAPALFTVFCLALVGETLVDWRSLGYVLTELLFMTLISATYIQSKSQVFERDRQLV